MLLVIIYTCLLSSLHINFLYINKLVYFYLNVCVIYASTIVTPNIIFPENKSHRVTSDQIAISVNKTLKTINTINIIVTFIINNI